MRFGILGPLEIWADDQRLAVGGPQQHALLAVLLLHANQVVSVDRLVDQLWGDRPPATAHGLLQGCVSGLRRSLRAGPGERLLTRPPGYLLEVRPGELDRDRFEDLAAAGRAAAGRTPPALDEAATLLAEALSCWRGPALDGVRLEVCRVAAASLAERRLAVLEERVEVDLRLGRAASLVAELRVLVADHPLRERLWAQLMLALHGADRQADALAAYQRIRRSLVDQLGVEPGAALQQAHRTILAGPPAGPAGGPAAPAAAEPAGVVAPEPPTGQPRVRERPVPAQLPADVAGFTGRGAELAELTGLLTADRVDGPDPPAVAAMAVLISAVSGTAGVGKTALAVRWAHQARDRFPDGQLYVDLRGYDPDQPVPAADALAGFLTALGVPGPEIPVELADRAARYRTELAGRRLLVVLDNAATVEQVRPLLPGAPSCVVLVTSRDSLAGLVARHGAHRVDLDLLPAADAVTLLRRLIGARVDAQPEAALALAGQCARLPLALRVAAELAAARPATALADLVGELADRQRRLDRLDAGDDPRAAVRAVFSWSYRRLPPDAARLFRLAGLHPGPDLDAPAAAALTGTGVDDARRALDRLARGHLIETSGAGRYRMHDLLRAYAAGAAGAEDSADQRRAALTGLFDYYLATAATASQTLYSADSRHRPGGAPAATQAADLTDPAAAREWLDGERPTLSAVAAYTADHGWPAHTVRLAGALFRYLNGGNPIHALAIHGHARRAARRTADRIGEAHALRGLGAAHLNLGRYAPAIDDYEQALALFRQAGDRTSEARTLDNLGIMHDRMGRYEQAAYHHQQAPDRYRQDGNQADEAHALVNLGTASWRLGRYAAAVDHLEQALDLCRRLGDRWGEAHALDNLGLAEQELGRHQQAAEHHRQALALHEQVGNQAGQASALDNLGAACTRLGRPEQAAGHHRRALALFRDSDDRYGEAWALNGLGEAALAAGRPADARTHHTAALAAVRDTGGADQQARAHAGLGRAYQALRDPDRARAHYRQAVTRYTGLGHPRAAAVRAQLTELDAVTAR